MYFCFLLAAANLITVSVGSILGGTITRKVPMSPRRCYQVVVCLFLIQYATACIEIFFGCDQPNIIGPERYMYIFLHISMCINSFINFSGLFVKGNVIIVINWLHVPTDRGIVLLPETLIISREACVGIIHVWPISFPKNCKLIDNVRLPSSCIGHVKLFRWRLWSEHYYLAMPRCTTWP